MRSIRFGAAVAAIAATLAMPAGASATQPEPVVITIVEENLLGENTFDATGGPVCATGTVSPLGGGPTGATRTFNGGQSFAQAQLLLSLRFECPDGSFDVLVRVTLDFATGDTVGTWSVLGGTGAYVSLHGAGSTTGDWNGQVVFVTHSGNMHLD
ncbi:MAG TPA: hypothetical protein VFZ10_02900 [Geminicoccaceae bacterium]